ncbi:MAG TPA: hypothetical protein VF428_05715 [Casimicrobiaceae bacterium]
MIASEAIAPREERLDSLPAMVAAQDELIGLARRHLKVFDIDLAWGGWHTAARCDALSRFLREHRGAQLSVIVQDTRWLEAHAARFTALLVRYGHAMTIYRAGDAARTAMDPLLIADDVHFLHRQHIDRLAATLSIGNAERAAPLVQRFDEIWASGEPGIGRTTLGL